MPLLLICHHRPIYNLPGGNDDFLEELWYCSPAYSIIPYAPLLWKICKSDVVTFAFALADKALYLIGGLRRAPTRTYARRKCLEWILEHQEDAGDWAGIFPPMHLGLLALTLEGYTLEDPRVRRGLEAVERFAWQDQNGKRIPACVSPIWDTALTAIALCDAQVPSSCPELISAISWLRTHQLTGPQGDWRIYNPQSAAGGFSFEYHNSWYPDIDDTAAIIIAFLKHDPDSASSTHVSRAVEWILGMQNSDGGWAAFDKGNDKLFMNKIPFSNMDSLCDPSTADVTGRVLETFGLLAHIADKRFVMPNLLKRTRLASAAAIATWPPSRSPAARGTAAGASTTSTARATRSAVLRTTATIPIRRGSWLLPSAGSGACRMQTEGGARAWTRTSFPSGPGGGASRRLRRRRGD